MYMQTNTTLRVGLHYYHQYSQCRLFAYVVVLVGRSTCCLHGNAKHTDHWVYR